MQTVPPVLLHPRRPEGSRMRARAQRREEDHLGMILPKTPLARFLGPLPADPKVRRH